MVAYPYGRLCFVSDLESRESCWCVVIRGRKIGRPRHAKSTRTELLKRKGFSVLVFASKGCEILFYFLSFILTHPRGQIPALVSHFCTPYPVTRRFPNGTGQKCMFAAVLVVLWAQPGRAIVRLLIVQLHSCGFKTLLNRHRVSASDYC